MTEKSLQSIPQKQKGTLVIMTNNYANKLENQEEIGKFPNSKI
jgi:hypothetical protein